MKKLKNKKGITLVALVITIVVLLILAVILINSINDNGIIGKAKEAKLNYTNSAEKEQEYLIAQVDKIDDALGIEKVIEGETIESFFHFGPAIKYNGLIYCLNNGEVEVYADRGEEDFENYEGIEGDWYSGKMTIVPENLEIASKVKINGNIYDVTKISEYAFWSVSNLDNIKSIYIPSTINYIGNHSGYILPGEVIVSENNSVYSSFDGVLYNKDKTELLLYPGVKTETTYNIPDGITTVSIHNDNLETVNVPNSITSLGVSGNNLKNINVSEGNTTYSSDNGVLFNKNKTELIMYPRGKTETTYTIPSSVTTIKGAMSGGGFSGCTNLSSLTIPNNVLNVDFIAFNVWTSSQTINVWWTAGKKPEGWNSMWNMSCNATIVYAPQ